MNVTCAALVLALALAAGPARADQAADRATARSLFFEASEAMNARDHARAAALFARSYALFPTPTAALGEARALAQLGRFLDAHERYQAIVARPLAPDASEAFQEAVESARREVVAVAAKLGALVIVIDQGLDAEVILDGERVAKAALGAKQPVDPGTHRVTARAAGHAPFATEVRVAAGEVKEVPLRLARARRAATPAPRRQPQEPAVPETSAQWIAGWVMLGLGGAALATWATTGVVYLVDQSTVERECDAQHLCSPAGLEAADRGRTIGLVNTVALFGGLALTGTGVAVLLTSREAQLATMITPGGGWLGVTGRF